MKNFKRGDHLVAAGLRKSLEDARATLAQAKSAGLLPPLLAALDQCIEIVGRVDRFTLNKPKQAASDLHAVNFGMAAAHFKATVGQLERALASREALQVYDLLELKSANRRVGQSAQRLRQCMGSLVEHGIDLEVAAYPEAAGALRVARKELDAIASTLQRAADTLDGSWNP